MPSTPGQQAAAARHLAKQARRLSGALTVESDIVRLLRYAEELEAAALDLEQRTGKAGQECAGDGQPGSRA